MRMAVDTSDVAGAKIDPFFATHNYSTASISQLYHGNFAVCECQCLCLLDDFLDAFALLKDALNLESFKLLAKYACDSDITWSNRTRRGRRSADAAERRERVRVYVANALTRERVQEKNLRREFAISLGSATL
jgi:hypothetical protein